MKPYFEKDGQTIYNMDCREFKASSDSIFVTDPPFNVGYHYNEYKDRMEEVDYYDMLAMLFQEKPAVVIHYPEALHRLSIRLEKVPERVVSWVYPSNTPRQHRDIAFYDVRPDFTKVGQPYKNVNDKRIQARIEQGLEAKLYDWWEINQVKNVGNEKTEHPCQMPLSVMRNIIGILPEENLIVDPFMGSGTTLVAAKYLKRKAVGIEISEKYCEIAAKRLEQGTLF